MSPTADDIRKAIDLLVEAGFDEQALRNLSPGLKRNHYLPALAAVRSRRYSYVKARAGAHPFLLLKVQQHAFDLLNERGPLQRDRAWNQSALIVSLTSFVHEHMPTAHVDDLTSCRRAARRIYDEWQRQQIFST